MGQTDNRSEQMEIRSKASDDEIELIDLLRVIWKWKYLILVGTLICALVTAIVSSKKQITFSLETILRVNPIMSIVSVNDKMGDSKDWWEINSSFIDSPNTTKSLIELGLLDEDINAYLKEFNNIHVSNISKFEVKVLGKENFLQVVYNTPDAKVGVAILNSLEPVLNRKYEKQTKIIQNNNYYIIQNMYHSVYALEIQMEVLKADIQNLSKSISVLESEIDFLDSNLRLMVKQREEIQKNSRRDDVLSVFLNNNTIQQNIELKNDYKNDLFTHLMNKDHKKSELKKLESKIQINHIQIKAFESKLKQAPYIEVVKNPEHNIQPIKPKTIRNMLIGALVGFSLFMFLSFFLDYIGRYAKTKDFSKNVK
jgi:capsular polysaccharide biosynthesis protein